MERISRVVGPVATNVHVLADARTREAIAIDTAIPSLAWIADELAARDWTLKLIVSTHGHWDHIGDNAAVAGPHRRPDRGPSARPRPPRAPRAALGAVRDPAVASPRSSSPRAARSGSARSGCGSCTRRATPRARSASTRPTRACCSAATRCSPAAGAGSTCRAATRRRWSSRSSGCSTSRTRWRVLPGHGRDDDDRGGAALAGARAGAPGAPRLALPAATGR